jgi:hypothetical protein
MDEIPYLWDAGRTKRVNVKCVKCGKLSNVDIFSTPKRRWNNKRIAKDQQMK